MKPGEVALVGIGEADVPKVGRDGEPGPQPNSIELMAEAALRAMEDAGLAAADVDGVITSLPLVEHHHMYSTAFIEYMGLRPVYTSAALMGGTTPHANVVQAAALIAAGICQTVLLVDGDIRRIGMQGDKAAGMASHIRHMVQGEYDDAYGLITPAYHALVARRHMHEFGTTSEQLAAIAVACRRHAALNPQATLQSPITVQDVLASPLIADPLHRLDCCLVSDWGGALILTSLDRARSLRKRPVRLLGAAEAHQAYFLHQAPSLTEFTIPRSGRLAFGMAGVTPGEVDFLEAYDSFTITALLAIEGLGFCGRGEGGPFVEGGRIELGGQLPLNTHGGQLAYSGGHSHFIAEAVRQLRGEAGPRQVQGAEIGVSQGTAALLSTSITLVLGRD